MSAVMEPTHWGQYIDGVWRASESRIEVRNTFDNALVGSVARGTVGDIDAAITAAKRVQREPLPSHRRYDLLMATADRIDAAVDEYAHVIALEGSKTIREARNEPPRAANILRLSAEEGRRVCGETLPFDSRAGSENRVGYYVRKPAGVIAAILPFNDPMAVAAHKVGPALAAGNSVVAKPDSTTPLTILMMARDLEAAGYPAGWLNVVTGHGAEIGDALVADPRIRVVSFTGGVETGLRITRTAGIKKLLLELGANSPVIVLPDARLDAAANAIVAGAFAQAGQNCLGVQRVFVHEDVYQAMSDRIVSRTRQLISGHSMDERTDVCPMIREREAERLETWIREAVDCGARVLTGATRDGALFFPTVLEEVPPDASLSCREAYGPVVSLYSVHSLDEAIDGANAVDYGLHAAVFTESLRDALSAADRLDVGGVIINDSTDYRLDAMPFGGTKNSGIGREGIRHAIEAMTEPRVVCINL